MPKSFSIDRVIRSAFSIYKQRLGRLLWTAAVLYVGGVVASVVLVSLGAAVGNGLGSATVGAIAAGVPAIGLLLAATVSYTGSVIKLVEAHEDGSQPLSFGESLRAVQPRIWPMIWVQLAVGLSIVLVAGALVGVGAGIAAIAGGSGVAVAIGAGAGGFLAVGPVIYLFVGWAAVTPVILLEGKSLDALGRSRQLVRGNGWSVLGVGVVYFAVYLAVSIGQSIIQAVGGAFLGGVVGLVGGVLFIPASALTYAAIYFELIRAEGSSTPDSHQVAPQVNGSSASIDFPPSDQSI